MVALADCADDNFRCFPGVAFLARKTGLSDRGIQRILRQAKDEGSLVVERQGGSGPGSRTVLRIVPEKLTERSKSPKGDRPSPLAKRERRTEKGERQSPKSERQSQNAPAYRNEPSLTVITRQEAQVEIGPSPLPEEFEVFWNAYPRHEGKQDAIRAARKLKRSEWPEVMAGLERWKRSGQWLKDGGQYVPYGSTFLNKHRWEDEPFVTVPDIRPAQQETLLTARDCLPKAATHRGNR